MAAAWSACPERSRGTAQTATAARRRTRRRVLQTDRTRLTCRALQSCPGDLLPADAACTYTEVVSRLDRITSDPEVCHGKPVIRGLRYPVADLLQLLAGGMTVDEVLADYSDLERDDVLASLEYGALAAGNRRIPLAG